MFKTLDEVKKANKKAGLYFFHQANMDFLESRIESRLIHVGERRFFVTSEKMIEKREFCVREADESGTIKTIGNRLSTLRKALEKIQSYE